MPTRQVGRYRLTRQLGVGMFSKVMVGVDDRTGTEYAVKVMRKDSLEEMDMARYVRREAAILRKLSHPNVVTFVEAIQSDTKLFLVMEIAPGTELLDVVSSGPLPEHDARNYMSQIVSAVSYLHSKGVVHRDLKPDNVLVDVQSGSLKLIDFGLTGIIRKNAVMRTACGSNYYSAPEVMYSNGDGYDGTKADAWSLGVLSYILLTGSHPFVDADGDLMTATMRQGVVEYPDNLSHTAVHFISRLLTIDPRRRYSVAQAQLHTWLSPSTDKLATYTETNDSFAQIPYESTAKLTSSPLPDVQRKSAKQSQGKRPGTFHGVNAHKLLFGRSTSDRSSSKSSPSLAPIRRRPSQNHGSGSFLWFRSKVSAPPPSTTPPTVAKPRELKQHTNLSSSVANNPCDDTDKDDTSRNLTLRVRDDAPSTAKMAPLKRMKRNMMKIKAVSSDVGRQSGGENNEFGSGRSRSGSSSRSVSASRSASPDVSPTLSRTLTATATNSEFPSQQFSSGRHKASTDRSNASRDSRITIDFGNTRGTRERMDNPPRVRRQHSLSSRTKAFLLRGAHMAACVDA